MRNMTILAVDDNEDSLELVREALTPHGFNVVCVASGPEAIQLLKTTVPAAIVLDIMMPGMDGFTFLDVIRDTPGLEEIPVILQTADPSRQHGTQTVDCQLTYMLAKPIDVNLFVRAVKDCLHMKRVKVRP